MPSINPTSSQLLYRPSNQNGQVQVESRSTILDGEVVAVAPEDVENIIKSRSRWWLLETLKQLKTRDTVFVRRQGHYRKGPYGPPGGALDRFSS